MPAKRQPVSVYNQGVSPPQGYAKAVIDEVTAPENRSVLTAAGLFVVCGPEPEGRAWGAGAWHRRLMRRQSFRSASRFSTAAGARSCFLRKSWRHREIQSFDGVDAKIGPERKGCLLFDPLSQARNERLRNSLCSDARNALRACTIRLGRAMYHTASEGVCCDTTRTGFGGLETLFVSTLR